MELDESAERDVVSEMTTIRPCSTTGQKKNKRKRFISITPSPGLQQKSLCLLAYPSSANVLDPKPVLYCVDFDEKRYKKKNYCESCRVKLFGSQEPNSFCVGGEGVREISPLKSSCVPRGRIVVSFGSTVYVLGGRKANSELQKEEEEEGYSNNVFYFDTNHEEEEGWKRGPDMLNPRSDINGGDAVVVDNKIYVFGGVKDDSIHPWAGEMLDLTTKNTWEHLPLPPPPPLEYLNKGKIIKIRAFSYGGEEEEEKKIMVGAYYSVMSYKMHHIGTDDNYYYMYNVKSGSWEKQVHHLISSRASDFNKEPTVAGYIQYWTRQGRLRAMNLKIKRDYSGKIKGYERGRKPYALLSDYDDIEPEPTLVYLGGKNFCLFTLRSLPGNRTKIRCTKFEISKRVRDLNHYERGTLKACVVARISDIVDKPLSDFVHPLVLDRMSGGIHKVEGSISKAAGEE